MLHRLERDFKRCFCFAVLVNALRFNVFDSPFELLDLLFGKRLLKLDVIGRSHARVLLELLNGVQRLLKIVLSLRLQKIG